MRQIILLFSLTVFIISCRNSPLTNKPGPLTGNIKTDLEILLQKGNHIVDIMDGVKQTPRQGALMKKFQDAIATHYDWFVEYVKDVPEGQLLPYHENLGLSKEEYEEFTNYVVNMEVISSGTTDIEIRHKNDFIYFKAKGKLNELNSLRIDLKNNTVIFGDYTMKFSDSLKVTDEKNGLRTRWKGYIWKFEEPGNVTVENMKDLGNLKLKEYEFTVGRLEKNDKTYMRFKAREVEDGAKTVEFEIPISFK